MRTPKKGFGFRTVGKAVLQSPGLKLVESAEESAPAKSYARAPELAEYDLLDTIGSGGMGVVYKARHKALNKTMAIKVLHRELAADPNNIQRFNQEVNAACMLTHANLVSIYSSGSCNDGTPYLVMDYLEGQSLEQQIKQKGELDLTRFLDVFIQTCEALQHAHLKGIIHRDLKPSNIMIVPGENGIEHVKIVDFGIARVIQQATKDGPRVTQTGDIMGSPVYMSPEQCLGLQLDARSDIYSLGILMYESLCGKPPFAGDNAIQAIVKHINEKPVPPSSARRDLDIPKDIETLIMTAMEKDAKDRFQSAEEVLLELKKIRSRLESHRKKSALSVSHAYRRARKGMRTAGKSWKLYTVVAATGALIVTALSVYWYQSSQLPEWQEKFERGEIAWGKGDFEKSALLWKEALYSAEKANAAPTELVRMNLALANVCMDAAMPSRTGLDEPKWQLTNQQIASLKRRAAGYYKAALSVIDSHPQLGEPSSKMLSDYSFASDQSGDDDVSLQITERLIEMLEAKLARNDSGTNFNDLVRAYSDKALDLRDAGNVPEAIESLRKGYAVDLKYSGSSPGMWAYDIADHLVRLQLAHGDVSGAEMVARDYIARVQANPEQNKLVEAYDWGILLNVLKHEGKTEEMEAIFKSHPGIKSQWEDHNRIRNPKKNEVI